MENEEVNKYLTEKMGLCWHEITRYEKEIGYFTSICNCGRKIRDSRGNKRECFANINLFSPEGFFFLWNWAIKQDWWREFEIVNIYNDEICWECGLGSLNLNLINPEAFAKAIYNYYLKESE